MQFIGNAPLCNWHGQNNAEWYEIGEGFFIRALDMFGCARWSQWIGNGQDYDPKRLEIVRDTLLHEESHRFRVNTLFRIFLTEPSLRDILKTINEFLTRVRPLQFGHVPREIAIEGRVKYGKQGLVEQIERLFFLL